MCSCFPVELKRNEPEQVKFGEKFSIIQNCRWNANEIALMKMGKNEKKHKIDNRMNDNKESQCDLFSNVCPLNDRYEFVQ